jgi:hypothetical protein
MPSTRWDNASGSRIGDPDFPCFYRRATCQGQGKRYRYRGMRILVPWMESLELGTVGRFARTDYDDIIIAGALDEMLATPSQLRP